MVRYKVASVSELPENAARSIDVDGQKIMVCNVAGSFHAVQDVCTHDGSPFQAGTVDGKIITCPRHGARFDVTTGAAVGLPAIVPLESFKVEVENGKIYIITG